MQWLKQFLRQRKKVSRRSVSPQQRRSSDAPPANPQRKLRRLREQPPAPTSRHRPSPTPTRSQDRRAALRPPTQPSNNAPGKSVPRAKKQAKATKARARPQGLIEYPNRREPMLAPRRSQQKRLPSAVSKVLVYTLRLSIIGMGVSAIGGTLLSALEKTAIPLSAEANPSTQETVKEAVASSQTPPVLLLKQENVELKARIQEIVARSPQLQAGVLLADLDTGTYVDIDGETSFAAASTIKLPLLVAFFQEVDKGTIPLETLLTMEEESIAAEAGTMQYQQPGTQFSALETVTKMITISDNTATNMILQRLGGAERLNQRFREWGLQATTIRNFLPDIEGTNTTSPMDLARVIAHINRGDWVSMRSRDRILEIMRNVVTNDLLPRGLDKDAKIAHKTGNIGSLLADAGLVDTPTGKRYIAVVMVQRPHNDAQAKELIRNISREAYQSFNQPRPASQTSPAKSVLSSEF